MVRPNYRDFRGSKFIIHSAKGSTWENHKYIKRVNGTYYYPDNYEGGRHIPDSEKSTNKDDLEDWEKIMYDEVDKTLKTNRGQINPKDIVGEDFQDFKVALEEFTGMDTDKLFPDDIERMRDRFQKHYNDPTRTLNEKDVENLAKEVIRGNFGNGQQRKDLLGENYNDVQKRVNELMKGSNGSKKVSSVPKEYIKKVEDLAKKVSFISLKGYSGIDMNNILNMYNKKSNRR